MPGLERSDRFAVVDDPRRAGHYRVQDTVTHQFVGRSYAIRRHALQHAARRNTPKKRKDKPLMPNGIRICPVGGCSRLEDHSGKCGKITSAEIKKALPESNGSSADIKLWHAINK